MNNSVAKYYKPKWTIWNQKTVRDVVIAHKRLTRRAHKLYLKSGSPKDLKRSQKILTRWEFD